MKKNVIYLSLVIALLILIPLATSFNFPVDEEDLKQHNKLKGLQGGDPGEFYHLNLTTFNNVLSTVFNITQFVDASTPWGNDSTNVFIEPTFPQNINITGNLTLGQKITFAFGEIIDNIVDGWIRVTGSLNVTENVSVGGILEVDGFGSGDIVNSEVDARFGGTNGLIQIGQTQIGHIGVAFGALDMNGTMVFRNANNDANNDIEFGLFSPLNVFSFAVARPAIGLATYNPRSFMIGGDLNQTLTSGIVNCTAQGYTFIGCDTDLTGADLGVEDDLEVRGSVLIEEDLNVTTGSIFLGEFETSASGGSKVVKRNNANGVLFGIENTIAGANPTSGSGYIQIADGGNYTVDLHSSLDTNNPNQVVHHMRGDIFKEIWRTDGIIEGGWSWEKDLNDPVFSINASDRFAKVFGDFNITQSLTVGDLISCDTINTTADGTFVCGTDATGAGSTPTQILSFDSGANDMTADGLFFGQGKGDGSEAEVQIMLPYAITVTGIYCVQGLANNADRAGFTLRDDGSNTAITCTTAAGVATCSQSGQSVSVATSSLLSIAYEEVATATAGHTSCQISYTEN